MGNDPDSDTERIRSAASRMFAALGFDATSENMIAEVAGVGHADIVAAGGKADLYRNTMAEAVGREMEVAQEISESFTADMAGLHRTVDAFVDLYSAYPEIISLWTHRSFSDAVDLPEIDDYRNRVSAVARDLFRRAGFVGAEIEFMENMFKWSVHGFTVGGIQQADGTRRPADDVEAREVFRSYMHSLLDMMASSRAQATAIPRST